MPPSRNRTRSQRQITTPQPRSGGYSGYRGSPGIAGVQPIRDLGAEALTRSLGLIGQITDKWENEAIKKEIDQARTDAYSSQIDNLTPPEYRYKASTEAWMGQKGDLFASHVGDELANKIANEFYPDVINQGQIKYEGFSRNGTGSDEAMDTYENEPDYDLSGDVIHTLDGEQFKTEAESIQAKAEEFLNTFIKDNNITDQNFLAGFYPRVNQKMKSAMDGVKKAQAERYMLERQTVVSNSIENSLMQHINTTNGDIPYDWNDMSDTIQTMVKDNGLTREVGEKIMINKAITMAGILGRPDLIGMPPFHGNQGTGLFAKNPKKSGFSYSNSQLFSKDIWDGYNTAVNKRISLDNAEQKRLEKARTEIRKKLLKEIRYDVLNSPEFINKSPSVQKSEIFNRYVSNPLTNDSDIDGMLTHLTKFNNVDQIINNENIEEAKSYLNNQIANGIPLESLRDNKVFKFLNTVDPDETSKFINQSLNTTSRLNQQFDRQRRINQQELKRKSKNLSRLELDSLMSGAVDYKTTLENLKRIKDNDTYVESVKEARRINDATVRANKEILTEEEEKTADKAYKEYANKIKNQSKKVSVSDISDWDSLTGKTQTSLLKDIALHNKKLDDKEEKREKKKELEDKKFRKKVLNSQLTKLFDYKIFEQGNEHKSARQNIEKALNTLYKDSGMTIEDFGEEVSILQKHYHTLSTYGQLSEDRIKRLANEKLTKEEEEFYLEASIAVDKNDFKKANDLKNKITKVEHYNTINRLIKSKKNEIRNQEKLNNDKRERAIVDETGDKIFENPENITDEDIKKLDIILGRKQQLVNFRNNLIGVKGKKDKKAEELKKFNAYRQAYDQIIQDRALNANAVISQIEKDQEIKFKNTELTSLYKVDRYFSDYYPINPEDDLYFKSFLGIINKAEEIDENYIQHLYSEGNISQSQAIMLTNKLAQIKTSKTKSIFNPFKLAVTRVKTAWPPPEDIADLKERLQRSNNIALAQRQLQDELMIWYEQNPNVDTTIEKGREELRKVVEDFLSRNIPKGKDQLNKESMKHSLEYKNLVQYIIDNYSEQLNGWDYIQSKVKSIFGNNDTKNMTMNDLKKVYQLYKNNLAERGITVPDLPNMPDSFPNPRFKSSSNKTPQSTTTNLPEGLPSEAKEGDEIIIDGVTYIYSINNGWFKQEGY